MVTKAKANSVVTHLRTGRVITFRVLGAGELELDVDKLSTTVSELAMFHGLIQRVSDAAAISRDTETGLPATPAAKLAAMQRLVEHYQSGTEEWSTGRSGVGAQSGGLLVQALVRLFPTKGAEGIRGYLKALKASERLALEQNPKVKAEMDGLRAQAAKGVDAEELLKGLED